jgi:putative ABC transport system substrate-binding protein
LNELSRLIFIGARSLLIRAMIAPGTIRLAGTAMIRRQFIGLIAGAAAWPLAAPAQQKAMPVVGYLHFEKPGSPLQEAFLQGLQATGYVAGRNVAIEYRWAVGQYDRSQAMAADLVGRKVDVIAAFGPPLARAAKDATSTIPIVFEVGNDAVEAGLVASLNRPGGNVTGLNILFTELTPKLLELIAEILPEARIVGLLVNPDSPTAAPTIGKAEQAARAKGIRLVIVKAGTESGIDAAFAALIALQAEALVVGADPFLGNQRLQLIAQAARAGIPAIYFSSGFTAAGGLISYGASLPAVYRRMGEYTGKILKGEKPANLPVEQPTKFDLSINLGTARTLGLNIPPSLLARADEVIE